MNKILIVVLIGVLLAGCTSSSNKPISHVYAFGDDFSDNGNCSKHWKEGVAKGEIPAEELKGLEENWEGGMTNGPVAVQVLAEKLNVPLTDYAVCAATSGQGNLNSEISALNNTGLLGQIDKFESELNGEKADADSLYSIEIGTGDFWLNATSGYKDDEAMSGLADEVIANLTTALTRLDNLGAKRFMVGNSFDLSTFPLIIWGDVVDQAKGYQTSMNAKLPGKMQALAQELDVEIELFDYTAIGDRIQSAPEQYGLTNLTDPCTEHPLETGTICAKPDEYYYWGYAYLSGRVHQIMGEAMAEQLSK